MAIDILHKILAFGPCQFDRLLVFSVLTARLSTGSPSFSFSFPHKLAKKRRLSENALSLRTTTSAGVYRAQPPQAALSAGSAAHRPPSSLRTGTQASHFHFFISAFLHTKNPLPVRGVFVRQLTERIDIDTLCFLFHYEIWRSCWQPPWLSLWESCHRR